MLETIVIFLNATRYKSVCSKKRYWAYTDHLFTQWSSMTLLNVQWVLLQVAYMFVDKCPCTIRTRWLVQNI